MRVYLAADHAGYELKSHLREHLQARGYDVVDVGAHTFDPDDDYPSYCLHAGARVAEDPGSLGIVVGGSGNGEQIAANKVPGVRAALAWSVETARLARQHNDANVLGIGGRMHTLDEAAEIARAFLETSFRRPTARVADRADRRLREEPASPATAGRWGSTAGMTLVPCYRTAYLGRRTTCTASTSTGRGVPPREGVAR